MLKPFEEIDFDRVAHSYEVIINGYADFPGYAEKAKSKLMELQESYLQKKLAYLESRAAKMSKEMAASGNKSMAIDTSEAVLTQKDKSKVWERIEESHFLEWAASHHRKTMDDFYEDQRLQATKISGIVETVC